MSTAERPSDFPALGRWIGLPDDAPGDPYRTPVLSRRITIGADVDRAELLVCGLGLQWVTIDGQVINDHRLDPAFSNVDHTVHYVGTDVTSFLTPGEHLVAIELGRGFYALPTKNVWHWDTPPWQAPLQAVAELRIVYTDGSAEIIGTDPSWRGHRGRTTYDCYYAGESYDATLAPTDPVRTVIMDGPTGTVVPQQHEPIRVTWSGPAITWTAVGDSWVADFGRTIAGWVSLHTDQSDGAMVTLTYAEQLEDDGGCHPVNEHVTGERFQRDTYTGNGEAGQQWEPRFTYKGFRYVQLDGLTHAPTEATATAHEAHNDVAAVGSFRCSEKLYEDFAHAMARTITNNLHHLPTDTPVYEKNGWTGDAQLGADTMLELFDLRTFMAKWLGDIRDSQRADGALPVIIPTAGWGYAELAPAPEWTTVYCHVLRLHFRWYGDRDLIASHWAPLVRYLDWELGKLVDGCAVSFLGDYLQPGTNGNGPDDSGVTASALLVRGLREAADLGRVLGHGPDADRFAAAADDLVVALNARYLERDHYTVGEKYSQTSNALPLVLGLVPAEAVDGVVASLVADLRRRDDHHHVGCIGAATLLSALTHHGHADLAHAVARQTTYPSWGYWFANGADTMWEMWELTARSRDHYFHGTVVQWLIEDVAGLRVGDRGFETFTVAPAAFGDLDFASYAVDTPRGRASSAWVRFEEGITVDVEVPPGSTATVVLPGLEPQELTHGRHQLTCAAPVRRE